MGNVYALAQQKGGVGKTTTTENLARAAVRLGMSVLCVDLDPQSNLTTRMAAELHDPDSISVADALSEHVSDVSLEDVIVPGLWGVDLAPASETPLNSVRNELVVAGVGRESRLRAQLEPLREKYDVILLDCPPDLSLLTLNALAAADQVLPVTTAHMLSLNGLNSLLGTIEQVRQHYNPRLRMDGVVLNMRAAGVGEAEREQEVRELGVPVFDPVIPRRVAIADAADAGIALDDWPGAYVLADLYLQLLKNVLKEN
ncbi:ParA family protein [Luteipulveratus halotolerans]|uniref:AAA domain-containing protein n=1 Tax=Luteipulveratus halotolerans TaxID=1631356 RepID=A0A0L6CPL0_9MICO|nr:ParA family protein [Luteipulveratus halotolerans]KNX39682.1 hypothetical protein VV01_00140 [Luteipulveratus halotolerans]